MSRRAKTLNLSVHQLRSLRKLHISVDTTGTIQATTVTDHRTDDASQVPELRSQVKEKIKGFIADGAYDTATVYQLFHKDDDSQKIIPPRNNAIVSDNIILKQRNEHISYIQNHGRTQ